MTSEPRFGDRVMVRAESVRVIAEPVDDTHRFKHAVSRSVGHGRYEIVDFDNGDRWPGEPIDETWEQGPRGYVVTPTLNGRVMARVRRIEWPTPEVCVVIGFTRRTEGIIATIGGSTSLHPPTRGVPLLEVARPPAPKGRGRIALVHRNDAYVVAS